MENCHPVTEPIDPKYMYTYRELIFNSVLGKTYNVSMSLPRKRSIDGFIQKKKILNSFKIPQSPSCFKIIGNFLVLRMVRLSNDVKRRI